MAGDFIAQSMNDQDFCLRRNLQWGIFGLGMSLAFYSPMWIRIYPRYINRYRYGSIGVAAFQTWFFEPFIFMPLFYSASAVFNNEFESNFLSNVFKKWTENFFVDFTALTLYGVPVFGANATLVPVKYRSWFVTICGTVFSAYIIYMKVDKVASTEEIVLARNAMSIIYEDFVPVMFDLHYYSNSREELVKLAEKKMSLEDFRAYCEKTYPTWHDDCIRRVFESMDADQTGLVTEEEITFYFESAKLVCDNHQKLLNWFDSVDKSKDGVLDKEEICSELRKWFNNDYVCHIFEKMDQDKDGFISKEQFIKFLDHQVKKYEKNGTL